MNEVPCADGYVRRTCFRHAKSLLRRGTPTRLVPRARTLHEPQPIARERSRQGQGTVALPWTDPRHPHARLPRLGALALPLLYARDVLVDWRRLWAGRRDLGLRARQRPLAMPFLPLLRLIDAAGMLRATVDTPTRNGWSGRLATSRRTRVG